MKKVFMLLLVVVSLAAILVAGCASTKSVEVFGNRLGANELDLKMAREKMDKVANSQESLVKDLVATKSQLLELTKATNVAIQELKKVDAKNEVDIQGLARKSEDLEKGLGLAKIEMKADLKEVETRFEKRFTDLRAYVRAYIPNLRKTVAEREARHSYKADEVEEIVVCFAGPFDEGKSEITKDKVEPSLEKALAKFKEKNCDLLEIHSFADKRGFKGKTAEEGIKLNVELSVNRGKATQAWLKTKGIDIPDEKIHAFGSTEKFGDERDCRTVVLFGKVNPPAPPAKTP